MEEERGAKTEDTLLAVQKSHVLSTQLLFPCAQRCAQLLSARRCICSLAHTVRLSGRVAPNPGRRRSARGRQPFLPPRALVNVDFGPGTVLGLLLIGSGVALYQVRTVRPEVSRDYDVFFSSLGLLCGGILVFQGWRLDPLLFFGQLLTAGTAISFAVEAVRLRSDMRELQDQQAGGGGPAGGPSTRGPSSGRRSRSRGRAGGNNGNEGSSRRGLPQSAFGEEEGSAYFQDRVSTAPDDGAYDAAAWSSRRRSSRGMGAAPSSRQSNGSSAGDVYDWPIPPSSAADTDGAAATRNGKGSWESDDWQ